MWRACTGSGMCRNNEEVKWQEGERVMWCLEGGGEEG